MKFAKIIVFVCCLLTVTLGQSRQGTIMGTVTDSFGAVIPEVWIEAKSKTGKVFKAKTDAEGLYRFQLPDGRYSLKFDRAPFNIFMISDYQIPWNGKMHLDVSLSCDGCEIVNSSN